MQAPMKLTPATELASRRTRSSAGNTFNRDYADEKPGGEDNAALNVFSRKDGTIRHAWGDEMGMETADAGQDPRGAPDPMPLWTILDLTPEGRGTDWYPQLEYDQPSAKPALPLGLEQSRKDLRDER